MRALFLILMLTACGPRVVYRDRVETVKVPVTVPCRAGASPVAPAALLSRYTAAQWKALTVKQKAELVGAQGLKHQSYGQAVDAATSACP